MDVTGAVGRGASSTIPTPTMYPSAESTCRPRRPTVSTRPPLMKIATVNAQNAGLQIVAICSFVSWNAILMAASTSPRIANTIDVVTSDTQLATKSLCLFMAASFYMLRAMNRRLPLIMLCVAAAAVRSEAQLAAPGEAGVVMGHLHLTVRDLDAQRAFWSALGGTP